MAEIELLTTKGIVKLPRDWYYCRFCTKGFSPMDTMLGMDVVGHKVTPEMMAKIDSAGQMAPSFEAAEDANRTRKGKAPENLALLRRLALNVVKKDKERYAKRSLKAKRFTASLNTDYLDYLLSINF